jgi:type I restriction enzyme S subunit
MITIMGTTGRACVAPNDLPECMSTKHLCVLSLNHGRVDPTYVWAAILHHSSIRSKSAPAGHGAIMEGWNMDIVRRLRLQVPPIELQAAFAERVADIQATIDQMDLAAAAAEQLQAALTARLFDGAGP